MSTRPDFILYDREGRRAVFVEVKNQRRTSSDWAAKLRRNLMAHGLFRGAEYLVLVTPDRLYFWKNHKADTPSSPAPPSYVADAQSILGPYFERAGLNPEQVSGAAFELIVLDWLGDLVRAQGPGEQGWLADSGLLDAIKDGRIDLEAAA